MGRKDPEPLGKVAGEGRMEKFQGLKDRGWQQEERTRED